MGIRNKLQEFFRGRYGVDNLSLLIFVAAAVLMQFKYVWILGAALIAFVFYRTLSKNINRRYLELQQFNRAFSSVRRLLQPLTNKLALQVTKLQQGKYYAFVHCPKCKKNLRLPKNKGTLQVTCPVCGTVFIKKT